MICNNVVRLSVYGSMPAVRLFLDSARHLLVLEGFTHVHEF